MLTFLSVALCAFRKTKRSINHAFVNPIYGNWRNPEKTEVSGNDKLYCLRRENTSTCTCTHAHAHAHTHARTHAHTHSHTRTHSHTHARARTHTRTHTHTHTSLALDTGQHWTAMGCGCPEGCRAGPGEPLGAPIQSNFSPPWCFALSSLGPALLTYWGLGPPLPGGCGGPRDSPRFQGEKGTVPEFSGWLQLPAFPHPAPAQTSGPTPPPTTSSCVCCGRKLESG